MEPAEDRSYNINDDCINSFCNPETKLCAISSCIDGQLGGNETDRDCGGDCSPCTENQQCKIDTDCLSNKCDYGYCKIELVSTNFSQQETTKTSKSFASQAGNFMITWGLILIGLFCIISGSGYLYYKSTIPLMPAGGQTLPGKPTVPIRSTRESVEHQRQEEERKRKLQDMIKHRLEHEEEEKKQKRSKFFEAFGGRGEQASVEQKPAEKFLSTFMRKGAERAEPKEEWVSLEDLNQKGKAPLGKPEKL